MFLNVVFLLRALNSAIYTFILSFLLSFIFFFESMYVLALNRVTYKFFFLFLFLLFFFNIESLVSVVAEKCSILSMKKKIFLYVRRRVYLVSFFFSNNTKIRKSQPGEREEYIKMCCALLYVLRITNFSSTSERTFSSVA